MADIVAFFAGTEARRRSSLQGLTAAMDMIENGSAEQHEVAAARRLIANAPWPTPKEPA